MFSQAAAGTGSDVLTCTLEPANLNPATMSQTKPGKRVSGIRKSACAIHADSKG